MARRIDYSARGVGSVFPLDAELNLPPEHYAHRLRRPLIGEAIRCSFDSSLDQLKRDHLHLADQLPKRQAEELMVALSRDFEPFYAQALSPATKPSLGEQILVISANERASSRISCLFAFIGGPRTAPATKILKTSFCLVTKP